MSDRGFGQRGMGDDRPSTSGGGIVGGAGESTGPGGFASGGAPRGALAVSAISVGLLIAGWLFIYVFVFLPRGTVG